MKFSSAAATLFMAATVSAQAVLGPNGNCLFPNGPTCVSTGRDAKGVETFAEPANSPGPNCCLFPLRCGNGVGGQKCIKGGSPIPGSKGKRNGGSPRKLKRVETSDEVEAEEDA